MGARSVVLAACAAGATTLFPAAADPGQSGSYEVTSRPGGPVALVAGTACDGLEGSTHVRGITIARSGWLAVSLTGFTGDWALELADGNGRPLAFSSHQADHGEDHEQLRYHVRAGQRVRIVTCNWAGTTRALVRYWVTPGAAWPRTRGTRTASDDLPYQGPAVGTAQRWFLCHVGSDLGCNAMVPPAWARYVTVQLEDAASPHVAATYYEWAGSTGHAERAFCTSTGGPIPITPGSDWIGVVLLNGPCLDGTPAQATRGTATFTWHSALPRR